MFWIFSTISLPIVMSKAWQVALVYSTSLSSENRIHLASRVVLSVNLSEYGHDHAASLTASWIGVTVGLSPATISAVCVSTAKRTVSCFARSTALNAID